MPFILPIRYRNDPRSGIRLMFDWLLKTREIIEEQYQAIPTLYVIDNKNHKDIAQLLGITENTSASQLHKAKALLAKKLTQYQSINSI